MNQGRIWCVVNPTVGLPLFLGSVAGISLIVHTAVLTNTNWMSTYWQGAAAKTKVSMDNGAPATAVIPSKSAAGLSITVTPVAATEANAPAAFMITVAPTAKAGDSEAAVTATQASGPSPSVVTAQATPSGN